MKKLLLTLLTIIGVFMLAACGSGNESGGGTGGSSANGSGDTGSDYPKKPIEVVVPAGAGGDTDLNTRTLAKYIEKELGQPLVVSNVTGSGGTVGVDKVIDAQADGYTVLAFHNSMLLNNLYGLSEKSIEDFKFAGTGVLDQANTFIVSKDSKFKNLEELIAYAKEHPKEVTMATEVGSMTYIQVMEFQQLTGVEFNVVDIGGASDKLTALLGGRVDIFPTSLGFVKSYIESGDFASLGVITEERLASAPDVPTFKEQGVDMEIDKVFYWAFPKETPDEVVQAFSDAMEKAVANEEFQEEIVQYWVEPVFLNGEETKQRLEDITELYKNIKESTE
ncbi:argininosuccinate lyase [Ureibacillus massiliensis 4400831 = CIP 108448 = CCUG 49529]|uniref:Argininosuccinate lyase n=2 Tax=cellular organisms TaxID=131567 RepID=A0A0A3JV52_9BACL|nr:tripartite tricarboxylate transporter substrate binding protein [Ureibacillus massiliensis]KGR90877.1 argininosuccinate lyase [Ureibacillus massiliensis 4400831 = CIP 108448 = CCUG 49529]